jgi:hypothetical protein
MSLALSRYFRLWGVSFWHLSYCRGVFSLVLGMLYMAQPPPPGLVGGWRALSRRLDPPTKGGVPLNTDTPTDYIYVKPTIRAPFCDHERSFKFAQDRPLTNSATSEHAIGLDVQQWVDWNSSSELSLPSAFLSATYHNPIYKVWTSLTSALREKDT